jgi:hypothetical protein
VDGGGNVLTDFYYLGLFDDLDNYSADAKDDAVLGTVEYTSTGDNTVEITIEAFQIRKKDDEKARDEL